MFASVIMIKTVVEIVLYPQYPFFNKNPNFCQISITVLLKSMCIVRKRLNPCTWFRAILIRKKPHLLSMVIGLGLAHGPIWASEMGRDVF